MFGDSDTDYPGMNRRSATTAEFWNPTSRPGRHSRRDRRGRRPPPRTRGRIHHRQRLSGGRRGDRVLLLRTTRPGPHIL